MISAPKPNNEKARLAELAGYSIIGSKAEKDFDEIVDLASTICETPISLVSLLDEKRQWFKAKRGLTLDETSRDVAFCSHAILEDNILVVNDATKDDRFIDNPLVTGYPNIRFYAGMPLISPNGYKMGTLCVIDNKPRELNQTQLYTLEVLSRQVVKQMELHKTNLELLRLNEVDKKLLSILAHDLRSPFNSITGVLDLIDQYNLSYDSFKSMVPSMRQAVNSGLELVANVVDWAVTQFQGKSQPLEGFMVYLLSQQIINNNQPLFDRKKNIVLNNIDVNHKVFAQKGKVEFVVRNLLLNANKFTYNGKIMINSSLKNEDLIIEIKDTGKGISDQIIGDLFSWDKRTTTEGTCGEKGSGLGLPMCKEFIESQGGQIWVESLPGNGTSFYFSLPLANN
jgi:signal transduction histidine kinase